MPENHSLAMLMKPKELKSLSGDVDEKNGERRPMRAQGKVGDSTTKRKAADIDNGLALRLLVAKMHGFTISGQILSHKS